MKNVTTAIDEGMKSFDEHAAPLMAENVRGYTRNFLTHFAQKIALAALQDAEEALPGKDEASHYDEYASGETDGHNSCLHQSHENIAKLKEKV